VAALVDATGHPAEEVLVMRVSLAYAVLFGKAELVARQFGEAPTPQPHGLQSFASQDTVRVQGGVDVLRQFLRQGRVG
jgi:hypothetical protein